MKYIVGLGVASILLLASSAMAQESSRDCEAIRARAAGSASLLLSPSVVAQGIKYPATGTFSAIGGSTTIDGYQARFSFLWSPLDAYKSTLIRELGDRDCAQQVAIIEAQDTLEYLNDIGKESAFNQQLSYLNQQKSVIDDLLIQSNKRLLSGTSTIMDVTILQQTSAALELKRVQAQGQLNILHAKKYAAKHHSFAELIANVQDTSMNYERQFSKIHLLDAWKFDFQGGIVPPMTSGDTTSWFGLVGITYNFGGIALNNNENKYLSARAYEIKNARYELTDQLFRFKEAVKDSITDMQNQLATASAHDNNLTLTIANLREHLNAPGALNAEALMQLQIIDNQSNIALMSGMIRELTNFYGDGK